MVAFKNTNMYKDANKSFNVKIEVGSLLILSIEFMTSAAYTEQLSGRSMTA